MKSGIDRRAIPVHDVPDAGHRVFGAADPHFDCVVRSFSTMFPGRRVGGGALAVYVDGQPVVDVWKGWADRGGHLPWSADTDPMVFSASKGMTATVIHRLADRGLIDYEAPVAEHWPEFAANGKGALTVREVMRHTAGLSGLRGATKEDLLDHVVMEERLAAAAPGRLLGKSAYHALTFGWLMSGLARAVTGKDMRVLFREELAEPLNSDGFHLGRPPTGSEPLRAAGLPPGLPQPADRQCDAGLRSCRAGRFGRLGRSRGWRGVRGGAQPVADTVRDDRSRRVRRNLCADPAGCRKGPQARPPPCDRVRVAVLGAGSGRGLSYDAGLPELRIFQRQPTFMITWKCTIAPPTRWPQSTAIRVFGGADPSGCR